MFIAVYLMLSYPVHPFVCIYVCVCMRSVSLSPPYSLRVRYWLWNKSFLCWECLFALARDGFWHS